MATLAYISTVQGVVYNNKEFEYMPGNSYSDGVSCRNAAWDYIVALTDTWLGISMDRKCIAELVPSGYNMTHVTRPGNRKGGCVALLYTSTMSFRLLDSSTTSNYTKFEHMDYV